MVVTPLIVVRVVAFVVVGYYALGAIVHLLATVAGVRERRRRLNVPADGGSPELPVTVVVPAYNEVETIGRTLASLLSQSHPVSVVMVDDGSTDGTFDAVDERFDLVPVEPDGRRFEAIDRSLTVIRQDNSGKTAALNAALDRCETPLFGVVDGDTVVEPGYLSTLAAPFADEATIAAGGFLKVTDAATVGDDAAALRLPRSWFQRFQALEVLQALCRQLWRVRAGCMVLPPGASSLYRTDLLREVGGFDEVSAEDFEVAVRLHRHCGDTGRRATVVQVPAAVAWTTVPTSVRELAEQRRRWGRGGSETLFRHRDLIGRRSIGRVGTVGLPYILLGEVLWPVVEGVGYVLVPVAWLVGAVSWPTVAVFGTGLIVAGPLTGFIAVQGTREGVGAYDAADRRALLAAAAVERLVWRPPQVFLWTYSVVDYFR